MSEFEDSPAFPIIHPDGSGVQYYGMTLRDCFAAKAMAMFHGMDVTCEADIRRRLDFSEAASLSYQYADAMLKERAK
jgi:exosortase/archaeosortase